MLDLHRLRLLQEFAARGSIARTAAVLGYTPSAVSQQLATLEREAGTALLDRSARRAELTDAGRRLARHAERILAMVEEAETDLSAAAVAFAPALARSLRAHPRLNLVLRQTLTGEGLRQVRSGDVDVAIVDDWTGRLVEEIELGGSILTCYHLLRDQLVLVLPRTHPAGRGPAARRGRHDTAGAVGVRGHVDHRQPGRARHRHRHPAPAGRRRGGPQDHRPGPAARPRPGPGRVRGGPHRERAPSLGGGDRDRAARGGAGPSPDAGP